MYKRGRHSPPPLPEVRLPQAAGPKKKRTKRELAELGEEEGEQFEEKRLSRYRSCEYKVGTDSDGVRMLIWSSLAL